MANIFAQRAIALALTALAAGTGLAGQVVRTPHPAAATIAKTYLEARNSLDHAKFQKWVDTYSFPGMSRIEKAEFRSTQLYGKHTFKKVVFDAPYEMIAEVKDGKNNTVHFTCWFDSLGKVNYILLVRDLYP